MAASDDRRKAAEEGKDVTPVMSNDKRKVTRIEITEKGPKEVEYDIVDVAELPHPVAEAPAVKAEPKSDK